jgi:CBS domain-containing protein
MKTERPFVKSYAETLDDVVMSRPVLQFKAEDTLSDILVRMRARGEKTAGVTDASGQLIGMLTESNIMRRVLPRLKKWPSSLDNLHKHKAVSGLIALDVMIAQPDSLHIDDAVEDALDVMTYLSHQYMPVIDSQKRLVGIVSFDELRSCVEKKYGAIKSVDDPVSLFMIQQKLYDLNLGYSRTY